MSSDDLEGLRLLRDRGPAGLEIAAGEHGHDLPYFRRMLEAGAVDVLQADDDTLIIADGFSCREQIGELTGRGALHLAQVLRMAMHEGPDGPRARPPEAAYQPLGKWEPRPSPAAIATVACAGLLAGVGLAYALNRGPGSPARSARRLPWN